MATSSPSLPRREFVTSFDRKKLTDAGFESRAYSKTGESFEREGSDGVKLVYIARDFTAELYAAVDGPPETVWHLGTWHLNRVNNALSVALEVLQGLELSGRASLGGEDVLAKGWRDVLGYYDM